MVVNNLRNELSLLILFLSFLLGIGTFNPISGSVHVLHGEKPLRYLFDKVSNETEERKCVDLDRNCSSKLHLCKNNLYFYQMKKNCSLTCGLCDAKKPPIFSLEMLMPDIQSINDSRANDTVLPSFASSLSKTIIKGTCYDEYIYCGEFSSLCNQQEYHEVMSRHCSLTCKTCEVQHKERETCQDDVNCNNMAALCTHPVYHDLLRKQCKKTCKVCKGDSIGCIDRHKNCAGYKADGFCDNGIYEFEERSYLCGMTCKMC